MIPIWMIYLLAGFGTLWFFIAYAYRRSGEHEHFTRAVTKSSMWPTQKPSPKVGLSILYAVAGSGFFLAALLMTYSNALMSLVT